MRTVLLLIGLFLVGACVDTPQPGAQQEVGSAALPSGAAADVAKGDPGPFEVVQHRIFDQSSDTEGRVVLHLLVEVGSKRNQLLTTLRQVIDEQIEADSSLSAIRTIGYVGRVMAGEGKLEPITWAEWIPTVGWSRAGPGSDRESNRVYFYHGTPPQW